MTTSGADPRISEFEQDLWKNFWKLYDDETYRKTHGVRVAMGQGVWGMFEKGKLYTITLQTDGGLTLTSEPLKGIYIGGPSKSLGVEVNLTRVA